MGTTTTPVLRIESRGVKNGTMGAKNGMLGRGGSLGSERPCTGRLFLLTCSRPPPPPSSRVSSYSTCPESGGLRIDTGRRGVGAEWSWGVGV
eukprot:scaffold21193_cov84-Isochrysis_galbana.AAC.1